jgi:hypothetical protein
MTSQTKINNAYKTALYKKFCMCAHAHTHTHTHTKQSVKS